MTSPRRGESAQGQNENPNADPDRSTLGEAQHALKRHSGVLSIGLGTPSWPLGSEPNGIVTYVATVAPVLAARGHRVSLFTPELSGPPGEFPVYEIRGEASRRSLAARLLDALRYRVAPAATWRALARRDTLRTVLTMVAEQRPDVLEMEESFGLAAWVRRACAVPVHVRLHGPWFLNGPAVGAPQDAAFRERVRAEGVGIAEADAVSAPSLDVLERVRARYGLALPDAAVIPNPTLAVLSGDRWRLQDCDTDRILFVGRFDSHKGGDLVIEAFARVLHSRPRTRLTFVGPDRGIGLPGGRTERLHTFVRARLPGALEDGRIEWLGAQPFSALPSLRRRALVTVVPSRYENHPGTVTEAMTIGCPVVAANVGGIPELVQHGVNGLLHRGGDPQDLAARILDMLRSPSMAERLGRRAGEDAEQRHHPEVVVDRLESLLLRTAARHRGRT